MVAFRTIVPWAQALTVPASKTARVKCVSLDMFARSFSLTMSLMNNPLSPPIWMTGSVRQYMGSTARDTSITRDGADD